MVIPICYIPVKYLAHRTNIRGDAAQLLHHVAFGHRSLDRVLTEASPRERDRPLLHELTIGSIRYYFSLADEIDSRLTSPLKSRDSIIFCLLVVGAYQLRHTRIPAYASVNETVDATRQVGRPWARGLINQVLRRVASEPPPATSSEEAAFDHPQWMIDLLRADYPDDWRAILAASLTRAPQMLRVNLSVTSRLAYQIALAKRGVSAYFGASAEALILDPPVPTAELPGLASGSVSVQDVGAMLAAGLLDPDSGDRVLDACAAPGGKAMHLLEQTRGIVLTALDIAAERCEFMRSECRRLGVDPGLVVQGDATQLNWWDGQPFQKVLLDAPCSGTGTMRRHPDIKLLKYESDLLPYQQLQSQLLTNLWRVLAPGGHLLYCTCSVFCFENDCVIDSFINSTHDVVVEPITAAWGVATQYGRQLLPEVNGPDGFYYAKLKKTSTR